MIKIGDYNTNTNIFLAPMAGCTDLPFRLLAREFGAKFCFYEMVDSNSLVYKRRQTYEILRSHKNDSPIAAQLLGSDPFVLLDAAQKLLKLADPAFLDINFACPAKKVIKKKAGAYLLRDAPRLYDILKKLIPAIHLPITIKLRIGYSARDVQHIADIARQCESLGVAAIFVHGRLMTQGYAGDIDYDSIKAIKNSVGIPVIGSGNIFSPEAAKNMLDKTGCDGLLVARGSLGNPWIFKQIDEYLNSGNIKSIVSLDEKKETLLKHLAYLNEHKYISPAGRLGYMKKITLWYLKSVPHASRMRSQITAAKSREDLIKVINNKII